ncbi:MAG: FecR domain-containing protein [Polyangiaceae bacterium]|nr:FecR domain-containing protein [Polyangiaceae bacterium]
MTDQDERTHVEEQLAEILDGEAAPEIYERLAVDDGLRDLRYQAERWVALVRSAGDDYLPLTDLEERVLAALDAKTAATLAAETPKTAEVDEPAPTTAPLPKLPGPAPAVHGTEPLFPVLVPAPPAASRTDPIFPIVASPASAPTTDLGPTSPALDPELPVTASEPLPAVAVPAPGVPDTAPDPGPVENPPVRALPGPGGNEDGAPPAMLPSRSQRRGRVIDFLSRHKIGLLAAGAGGLFAAGTVAASIVAFIALRGVPEIPGLGGPTWSGTVAQVARAGGSGDLELCDRSGARCQQAKAGDPIPAGAVVRTGPTVRAHLTLNDGTELSLDRDTRLAFDPNASRRLRVDRGAVVADVKHRAGAAARLDVPVGHIKVLGTKFSLVARPRAASVGVSRGRVELVDDSNRSVEVHAGEEGRILAGEKPYSKATQLLGEMLAWSDEVREPPDREVSARGLGELRAKKPTDKSERDAAVTLTSHAVKVRISGAVARTEVDETFRNETGDVLEGIYRFPLPPDAKIERLALEVDGRLEEGAFVDRDRAAAIWRGSIVNAAPEMRREITDEIVWVPGPWRDPALLEWQRGSRFELRIFPIPARGSRRVILAYTQVLEPSGNLRRYTYPLAHDPSGSTRVSDFRVDVQVRGHDAQVGVAPRGYPMTVTTTAEVATVTHAERNFVPAGDLVLEFALPDRDREVTAWAYAPAPRADQGRPAPAAAISSGAGATPDPWASGGTPSGKPSLQAAPTDSGYPYAAIAIRPELPRMAQSEPRTFALVVDSSRSMYGENYQRATLLAARLIRELGDEDRFTVLACDTTCQVFPGGLQAPGRRAGREVETWLAGILPEGASDPTAALGSARDAAGSGRRALRIVYLGDGTPTSGPVRPATVTEAARRALRGGDATVTAVAIGADSDLESLRALVRGGGGVVLPYVPGQSTAEAAFATLAATLGHTLREVTVELPSGLVARAPEQVDAIPAGHETILVARMTRPEVAGDLVLRGTLGQERFERRYPLRVVASSQPGNAFVPRLYAATRIADLERHADAEAKTEAIALSSRFDVASRYTSLLVLESAAMFKAFGLDNRRDAPDWTGEEDTHATTAEAEEEAPLAALEDEPPPDSDKKEYKTREASKPSGGSGWGWPFGRDEAAASPRAAAPAPTPMAEAGAAARPPAATRSAPRPTEPDAWPGARERQPLGDPLSPVPEWEDRRRWVPMRRVWTRKGEVITGRMVPLVASVAKIAEAERAVTDQPNKRGAVRQLYVLYAVSGDLRRAEELAQRWSEKEPLDPEALTARADLAAQRGDRELAIRILGSVVDVRPGDVKAQERLARLHRWAGQPAAGCRHSIAAAELHQKDDRLLATAVECARATDQQPLAELLLGAAVATVRARAEQRLAKPSAPARLSGDLRIEATWLDGGNDLDIGLITPDGHRVSWLGAPTREVISAEDATSERREGLALRGATPGEYVVELVRGRGNGRVTGEVKITVAGTLRTVPFSLTENRTTIGIAKIAQESRLVPVE